MPVVNKATGPGSVPRTPLWRAHHWADSLAALALARPELFGKVAALASVWIRGLFSGRVNELVRRAGETSGWTLVLKRGESQSVR